MSYRQHTNGREPGATPPKFRAGHTEAAGLQDLLTYCLMGLGQVAIAGMRRGIKSPVTGLFTARSAMATLENSTLDLQHLGALIQQGVVLRDQLKARILTSDPEAVFPGGPADFEPATTLGGLLNQACRVSPVSYPARTAEVLSLKQILLLGTKGVAAWLDHAKTLGLNDEALFESLMENLSAVHRKDLTRADLVALVMALGKTAQRSMALQDRAMADTFGRPCQVTVPLGGRKGRAILVSGRDFHTLEALLTRTEGKNVFIYTHGEMLGAHQFPLLNRYGHLWGHLHRFGEDAALDFSRFPGAVLMTGRGQMPAEPLSGNNLFTAAPAFRSGIPQISMEDFSPLVNRALAMPGFIQDDPWGRVRVGKSREALEAAGGQVAERYRKGRLDRILIVAVCGGTAPVRLPRLKADCPENTVMITLCCCGSRPLNPATLPVPGLSWQIDLGEGHDAHGVVRTVLSLAEILGRDVAALPLTMILAWTGIEVLPLALCLYNLGVKDIHLTRSAPVSPDLLRVLDASFHDFG